jgi:hypothetical protein
MDDELNQKADEIVTLTPDVVEQLKRSVAYLNGATYALRLLARRSYISADQAPLILAEIDELCEMDIAPLRTALRDGTLCPTLWATIERLGRADVCDVRGPASTSD